MRLFHPARRLSAAVLALLSALVLAAPAFARAANVRVPTAGEEHYGNSAASIDVSNVSQGYLMARYSGSARRAKLQITGGDKATYTYDLHGGGFEVFPLTAGSGNYTVNIYENVAGNQYALAYGKTIAVQLENATLPYLYPSQYVRFTAKSAAVAKGVELAQGAASELEIVSGIYNYVIGHVTYDGDKAANVKSGYLPDPDATLATGRGICFDYAALMAAMLRSQDIPTRLEVGYVSGGIYHAWITTYITDVGWINGIIQFDGKSWKLMDPTFASNGGGSPEIMQFIGNGSNYSAKYRY